MPLPTPESNGSPHTAKPRKTRRNGKIARLPKIERDMVNRLLADAVPYASIVDALDDHDIKVTVRNISNWATRGGYREWCQDQAHVLETRLQQDTLTDFLRDDATELPEVGLQILATRYSQILLRPETDPKQMLALTSMLCRISNEIIKLHKFRDRRRSIGNPGYQFEREKKEHKSDLEITRQIYSGELDPEDDPRRKAPSAALRARRLAQSLARPSPPAQVLPRPNPPAALPGNPPQAAPKSSGPKFTPSPSNGDSKAGTANVPPTPGAPQKTQTSAPEPAALPPAASVPNPPPSSVPVPETATASTENPKPPAQGAPVSGTPTPDVVGAPINTDGVHRARLATPEDGRTPPAKTEPLQHKSDGETIAASVGSEALCKLEKPPAQPAESPLSPSIGETVGVKGTPPPPSDAAHSDCAATINHQPSTISPAPPPIEYCPACRTQLPPLLPDGERPSHRCAKCGSGLDPAPRRPGVEYCPACARPLPPLLPNGRRPNRVCSVCGCGLRPPKTPGPHPPTLFINTRVCIHCRTPIPWSSGGNRPSAYCAKCGRALPGIVYVSFEPVPPPPLGAHYPEHFFQE